MLETRVGGLKADRISSKMGFDAMFRVDPDGFASGIWVFWEKNLWQLDVLSFNSQVVHMRVGANGADPWYFSACYGRPQRELEKPYGIA